MSTKLDHLYEFAKNLGFTETTPLWETTPSIAVMHDFRIFPNTVRDIKAEVDARIAELTTEVADLKSKLDFANAMNADQDKTVAGLTAEVAKYRKALGWIANGRDINAWLADIARNALKDGV